MAANFKSEGIAEAGMTRVMSAMIQVENREFLTQDYETPEDMGNFAFASGDVQEGSYQLLSYDYNEATQQGTFVIQGELNGSVSRIEVTRDIEFRQINGSPVASIARVNG